jgi:IS30 family transposase
MGRGRFSGPELSDLWERWQEGQSLVQIARALSCYPGKIYSELARRGGFAPPRRHRAARQLGLAEREEISRGLANDDSLREIARRLGRPASTVSREVRRHGGREAYRAGTADERAWHLAQRPKACKLAQSARLRTAVARKLCLKWSPEQISGWLSHRYPGQSCMQVSHETIYRSLFIQARGLLKKQLLSHLRAGHRYRRGRRPATEAGRSQGPIPDAISIRERPAEAEDRAVPGHWEGDLIVGAHNASYIATLVERRSRYLMLIKVNDCTAEHVAQALTAKMRRLPTVLRRSLTWDRGREMAQHKAFSLATDMQVYFCDPQSPWQRGSNENTNGLLRQYFPKGTDLSVHSQRRLDAVAKEMNQRPRETLGFHCPADVYYETLR